jgi:hypothetical protein
MDDSIHPWRWRAVVIWIVIFTVVVVYALHRQFITTDELKSDKASIAQLRTTNCGLERFLLTARKTRWRLYKQHHNPADLAAVKGYEKLVGPFTNSGFCKLRPSLLIKGRPLHLSG